MYRIRTKGHVVFFSANMSCCYILLSQLIACTLYNIVQQWPLPSHMIYFSPLLHIKYLNDLLKAILPTIAGTIQRSCRQLQSHVENVHLFFKLTNPNKHSKTSRPSDSLIELLLGCYELVHTCNAILKCVSRYAKLNNKKNNLKNIATNIWVASHKWILKEHRMISACMSPKKHNKLKARNSNQKKTYSWF